MAAIDYFWTKPVGSSAPTLLSTVKIDFCALHYSPSPPQPNVHWEPDSFWHWMNDLIHFLCWTPSESTCVMIPHAVSDEFFSLVDSIHQVFIRLKKLQSRENELFLYIDTCSHFSYATHVAKHFQKPCRKVFEYQSTSNSGRWYFIL